MSDISRINSTMPQDSEIKLGTWYWVKEDDKESTGSWLGCVMHIGSNYAKLENVYGSSTRVHFDVFDKMCKLETDPQSIIKQHQNEHQTEVRKLIAEVERLSLALSITPVQSLGDSAESHALAKLGDRDVNTYKADLVKAKSKTIPELFKKIEHHHEQLAHWMQADVMPLKAMSKDMDHLISNVENRIFNIELYAGLTEHVEQIAEGKPAGIDDKIHLMQRRCYMDEECLMDYKSGGMEFKDIKKFDKWLAKPSNRDRILPFPKCIVSFRIRRRDKERHGTSIRDFIRFFYMEQEDKLTFLYIRNGDQLYRMSTELEFGDKFFPDMEARKLSGEIWAKCYYGKIDNLISGDQYAVMLQEDEAELKKYELDRKLEREKEGKNRFPNFPPRRQTEDYYKYSPKTVYFDDIKRHILKDVNHHNRVAIILQGLLDRSPIFHPHRSHKLWTSEGFESILELVYDESKALNPAELPDFEEYRNRLNRTIKEGTVTVGQEEAWVRRETDKYNKRENAKNWNRHHETGRHTPYGDPGPGLLAKVHKMVGSKCFYAWEKQRAVWSRWKKNKIPAHILVSKRMILNVEAYVPGDYKKFFSDPRTRMEYMQWAPLLLAAEDYHAGTRKIGTEEQE